MTTYPVFGDDQFVDASALTTATFNCVVNTSEALSVTWNGGLCNEWAITSGSPSGMSVTWHFGPTFRVLFPAGPTREDPDATLSTVSGWLGIGQGTTDTADLDYTFDFTSFVPGSGSVTAYIVASGVGVSRLPVEITGPPPFHPDYDPTFVPYTLNTLELVSLNVYVTLTPADNIYTFELGRTALTAGQVVLGDIDLSHQQLAQPINTQTLLQVTTISTPSAGAFSPLPNTTFIVVEAVGAGGGGGGSVLNAANESSLGSPGTSGAWAKSLYTTGFADGVAYVVGSKGVGSPGAAGTNGTNTIFAHTPTNMVATGGTGGGLSASAPIPLAGGNGATVLATGANWESEPAGGGTQSISINGSCAFGANGGDSHYGPGALGQTVNADGQDAISPGAGGGGTANYNNGATTPAGGDGADGLLRIWEYAGVPFVIA